MTWAVIVKKGKNLHVTLASIYFDRWGKKTNQSVIECSEWQEGYQQAKELGHSHALFVDSGTVFKDWPAWKSLVDQYSHKGLIAHILWHPGENPKLHSQCWFMDLQKLAFSSVDSVTYPSPIRSDKNIHDDYTPLWIKPGKGTTHHEVDGFGQDIMSAQLCSGDPIVNWNNSARDLKFFAYKDSDPILNQFEDYIRLAESQLWVLNNEPIEVADLSRLICPGSGLFWIANMISMSSREIKIIDISSSQVEFCRALWRDWDGHDYGLFAWNFIRQHNINHFQLDRTDFTPTENLRFKKSDVFIPYVNERFNKIFADRDRFVDAWVAAKREKAFSAEQGNIVDWVLSNRGIRPYDKLWTSNILDYKWTMLHVSSDDYHKFKDFVE